jgi:hypothetical protein
MPWKYPDDPILTLLEEELPIPTEGGKPCFFIPPPVSIIFLPANIFFGILPIYINK